MTTYNPYNEPEPVDDGDDSDVIEVNDALKKAVGWEDLKKKKIEVWKSYMGMTEDGDILKSRKQKSLYEAELVFEAMYIIAPILRDAPRAQGSQTDKKNLVSSETRSTKPATYKEVLEKYDLTKKQGWLAEKLTEEGKDHEIEDPGRKNDLRLYKKQ